MIRVTSTYRTSCQCLIWPHLTWSGCIHCQLTFSWHRTRGREISTTFYHAIFQHFTCDTFQSTVRL